MSTGIEWTDETWNPVVGCSRVSAGCKNCYAFKSHDMRHKAKLAGKNLPRQYEFPFTMIQLFEDRLAQPASWKKPRMVFVNSVSDLFHENVPFEFILEVWNRMAATPHTYQILTKRPYRMLGFFEWLKEGMHERGLDKWEEGPVPLPNVWLGVSVEDQRAADERIPLLLQAPAAVRFISGEPLLGPVEFSNVTRRSDAVRQLGKKALSGIDWVIVGGESGPGARPMHPDWARSLRDQCQAAGVPFFFKQWGEWEIASVENGHQGSVMPESNKKYTWVGNNGKTFNPSAPNGLDCYAMARVGKKKAGRLLDGREWNEFPLMKGTP